MAAMIAIMLYRELPVATFEAQRQKEELLIDRGNEYKRAVQLYVRKLQSFPPSLDALENTNRMRFLRARYTDPFTGKADWRILHAGPGGIITDSKIKQVNNGLNGASGTQAGTLGAPSAVTSPFANSFNGADPNGQQQPGGPGNNFPQRPPAVYANGAGAPGQPANADMYAQNGGQPIDPQTMAAIQNGDNGGGDPNQAPPTAPYPGYPGPGDPSAAGTSSGMYQPGNRGRYHGSPVGNSYPPGQFGPGGVPQDPMAGALATSNPPVALNNTATPSAQGSPGFPSQGSAFGNQGSSFGNANGGSPTTGPSGMGVMNQGSVGGGIAGVASSAPGKTIKLVNDQKDRSLWEFVYDMQKEMNANAPSLGNTNSAQQGSQGAFSNGNSSFSNGNSSFSNGSSSFSNGNSSFSNGTSNGTSGQPSAFPSLTPIQQN
jgi:uncharacterized membrane protein YgcG